MQQVAKDKKIKDYTTSELPIEFTKLLSELVLITGLKAPFIISKDKYGKEYEDVTPFAKEVSIFLTTHWNYFTLSEIVLAFRFNAASELPGENNQGKVTPKLDFYGTIFTLDQIGGVLYRYRQKRANLAAKIDYLKPIKELPPPSHEQDMIDDKIFCEEYYKKWLNGEFSKASTSYAYMIYDRLERFGKIRLSLEEKKDIFAKAQRIREQEISAPQVDRELRKDNMRILESYLNEEVPKQEQDLVKTYAKRIALFEYFNKLKGQKKKTIF